MNGYRFHTHSYTQNWPNRKTINSGVLCKGTDEIDYYGRVEHIYELDYGLGNQLNHVVLKCHWFNPTKVRRNSVYAEMMSTLQETMRSMTFSKCHGPDPECRADVHPLQNLRQKKMS
jgi:hypothetical protein